MSALRAVWLDPLNLLERREEIEWGTRPMICRHLFVQWSPRYVFCKFVFLLVVRGFKVSALRAVWLDPLNLLERPEEIEWGTRPTICRRLFVQWPPGMFFCKFVFLLVVRGFKMSALGAVWLDPLNLLERREEIEWGTRFCALSLPWGSPRLFSLNSSEDLG